jgi:hypothetical protein
MHAGAHACGHADDTEVIVQTGRLFLYCLSELMDSQHALASVDIDHHLVTAGLHPA